MDAKSSFIAAFLRENKQYVAPVYQRNYAWLADKQCQALWDDLVSLTSSSKSKHFLGSVVVINLDDSLGRNFVIDGQQRLTTIQLILLAIRDYVKEQQEIHADDSVWLDGGNEMVEAITALLFNNSSECKLELNGDDRKVFASMLRAVPTSALSYHDQSTNIFLNYTFFSKKLHGFSFDDLSKLYRCLTKNLEIACIVLENRDNPQRVFESLNSTGLDLQGSDLIRNYVLMSSDGNEAQQKELFDKYWHPFEQLFPSNDSSHLTNFFLNLVAVKQFEAGIKDAALAKPKELYVTFKRYYANDKVQGALVYAPELLQYGVCYARIMGWQKEEDEQLALIFADLKWLAGSASNPFASNPFYALVLYLYYCYQSRRAGWGYKEFLQACRNIVSGLVRRAVCSRQSQYARKLRGIIFFNLAQASDLSKQLEVNFSSALENDILPKDSEFEYSLKTIDLYHTNTRLGLCRFLLTRLAELNMSNSSKALESMTIEHILPQNKNLHESWQKVLGEDWQGLQQLWLHRLGNLTLTFENSKIGDKPFADKLGFYRKSAIPFINDYVVGCSIWSPEQIEQRGKLMAQKCLELWPMPKAVDISLLQSKPSRRGRNSISLNDYCGASESLLKSLKEIDRKIRARWGDLQGFKCLMKPSLIEYCVYTTVLAIIQPNREDNTIKLWLHCYYKELPYEVRNTVKLSRDWISWAGDEVCMDIDSTEDSTALMSCYYLLGEALDAIKLQAEMI